jgi:aconitate hydratase
MGVLPLEFAHGESFESLGLTGHELVDIVGIEALNLGELPKELTVRAGEVSFITRVRIDTPMEAEYYRHGGILPYVLRQLAASS